MFIFGHFLNQLQRQRVRFEKWDKGFPVGIVRVVVLIFDVLLARQSDAERMLSVSEDIVEETAQVECVHPLVQFRIGLHFGRDPKIRPLGERIRIAVQEVLAAAQIGDLDQIYRPRLDSQLGDEEIIRLDVAMNQVQAVQESQSFGGLSQH